MSDQGFREVHLSGKQVVFLFMACAVALIGTFLLGVSVGRHVEPEPAAQQAASNPTEAAVDPNPNAPLPPKTEPKPGLLDYPKLQDKPAGAAPSSTTPVPTPEPSTPPADQPKPAPPAASPKPAAESDSGWFVQVNSFATRDNAVKEQSGLKAKGVTAAISVTSGKTPYRVRLGPFSHVEANGVKANLEKLGYKPRVTR